MPEEFVTQEQLKTAKKDIISVENFPNHFMQALAHSKPMTKSLSKIMIELIKSDEDLKKEVAATIIKINNDQWKTIRNKTFLIVCGGIWTLLISLAGVMVGLKMTPNSNSHQEVSQKH
jgi:hypothetical protein